MKHLHLNNHISSKQDVNAFAKKLFDEIIQSGHRTITMTIDDGDGDVWKYTIDIESNRTENIQVPITEN